MLLFYLVPVRRKSNNFCVCLRERERERERERGERESTKSGCIILLGKLACWNLIVLRVLSSRFFRYLFLWTILGLFVYLFLKFYGKKRDYRYCHECVPTLYSCVFVLTLRKYAFVLNKRNIVCLRHFTSNSRNQLSSQNIT